MVLSDDEVNGDVMGIRTQVGLAVTVVVIDLSMAKDSRKRLGIGILAMAVAVRGAPGLVRPVVWSTLRTGAQGSLFLLNLRLNV